MADHTVNVILRTTGLCSYVEQDEIEVHGGETVEFVLVGFPARAEIHVASPVFEPPRSKKGTGSVVLTVDEAAANKRHAVLTKTKPRVSACFYFTDDGAQWADDAIEPLGGPSMIIKKNP